MSKKYFTCIMVIGFFLAGLGIILTWNLRNQMSSYRTQLATAESHAYWDLNDVHYQLIEEQKLKLASMLRLNAQHSIFNLLRNIVSGSLLKEISIYHQNCSLLASSSGGLPLQSQCRQLRPQQTFYWSKAHNPPTLHRLVSLPLNGRPIVIELVMELKTSWFKGLSLPINFETLTKHPSWQSRFYRTQPSTDILLQTLLLISSLGLGFQFISHYRKLLRAPRVLEQNFSNYLKGWGNSDLGEQTLPQIMETIKAQWIEKDFDNRAKNQKLMTYIKNLEAELHQVQKELSPLKNLESLATQMRASSQQFLNLSQEITSQSEDISDTIAHSVIPHCQGIFHRTSLWSKDLETISARKLLRTLSERIREDGQTQLDYDLTSLIHSSRNLANVSIQLSILCQKLGSGIRELKTIGSHWAGLVDSKHCTPCQLEVLIIEAQMLVPLTSKGRRVTFENQNRMKHNIADVPSPNLWKSILFHLYQACLECSDDARSLKIYSSIIKKDSKNILVISSSQADKGFDSMPKQARKHFTLAQSLARRLRLEVFTIPFSQGRCEFAICWQGLALDAPQNPSISSKIDSRSMSDASE